MITTHLFVKAETVLHSGAISDFKINVDRLTTNDLDCLAYVVSKKYQFYKVFGIPSGGDRFALALLKYRDPLARQFLIVDDVFTTGNSMADAKANVLKNTGVKDIDLIKGVVIFARDTCPEWITPIFQIWPRDNETNLV